MITSLLAGLLALSPLLAAPAAAGFTVEDPGVWRQAQELLQPQSATVDLRVSFMRGGSFFNVDDSGLGIHVSGQPGTNGSVRFSGRAGAGAQLAFEAVPLSSSRPMYGYQFRSGSLSGRVVRFGRGLLIDGQAGGRPFVLTLDRTSMPDSWEIAGRDGTRLKAWITSSYAGITGAYLPEKMTREGLSVLGAAVALMFSEEGGFPDATPRPAPLP
jgi:hypothetical protein